MTMCGTASQSVRVAKKKQNKTKEKVIHGLTYLAQKFENMKFSCFNPCKNRVSI
jgi:hypothetical protein